MFVSKSVSPVLKILFVTNMFPSIARPAFGIFVKEQIDQLGRSIKFNHDVYFINARDKGNLQYLLSLIRIPFILRRNRYDVVHIHYGISGLFLLLFKPSAKVYITLHGADILKEQGRKWQILLTKRIVRRADKVIILSKEMEDVVSRLGVPYEIIPCGVDADFFEPASKPDKQVKEGKTIVFPGDPEVQVKNYPLFMDVINEIRSQFGMTVEVRCLVNLTREGVKELMNIADCLMMTSFSEGSPQTLKEALACGLPVVSVNVGDAQCMLENIPGCYISHSYDVDELSRLVLLSFSADRKAIRKTFLDKRIYDHESVIRRLSNNYLESYN